MKLFSIRYFDKLSQFVVKNPVHKQKVSNEIAQNLLKYGYKKNEELLNEFKITLEQGISKKQRENLLEHCGLNEITHEKRKPWIIRILLTFKNPLIILLLTLTTISFSTGDIPTTSIVSFMIFISVVLRFTQEEQAFNAAEKLRSMVKTTCAVIYEGKLQEIDIRHVVPGDIVQLAAGDIVPADMRILNSKDLFINQSLLTGEALPVEKHARNTEKIYNPIELSNLCFMGTNVESGTAQGIIVATGSITYFGSLAKSITGQRVETSFDKGVDKFTWLMIWFMLIMTPIVFLINGFGKGNWWEAFLFAISVAVGLTPEMLPAIVAVNLSKGSMVMSKKKVIVKRLSSIQNFGAMNVLCTDKTGTLTQNKIALIENINIDGKPDTEILHYAFLNSYYQTGFRNLLDDAVMHHVKSVHLTTRENTHKKVDELPFDFKRKRLSIIVENEKKEHFLICKGAVEEVLDICVQYDLYDKKHTLTEKDRKKLQVLNEEKSSQGFRVIAVGYKKLTDKKAHYSLKDEEKLTFLGFMTFFDPPKESAASAIKKLEQYGITVKVLTGDNELVTKKVGKEVGLADTDSNVLLGNEIEQMSDEKLQQVTEITTIFAKLSPVDKKRIVQALQKTHVVGFLGDGINDAPALRSADVGISVDSAVDIAKESADIILLELSLLVLAEGVIEGRKVFGNIIKYIRMGASSNFGNMFSVLGASLFLPFLPMSPLQIIANNLLYDISQTAIPTDVVDPEYIEKPRKWDIVDIRRFMFFFGPTSSIFDYVTFGVMIFIFHAWTNNFKLFQTGWFVESLLTQTLIVHVIRSKKIPFVQTWSSNALLVTTIIVMAIGVYLPFSPLAPALDFIKLPPWYWPILEFILLSYVGLTQLVKVWYTKKFGYN